MNPSIQHFTIMNRDLANQSNHLDREKKEVGQLENEKIKKTKSDVNLLKENMMDNKCGNFMII